MYSTLREIPTIDLRGGDDADGGGHGVAETPRHCQPRDVAVLEPDAFGADGVAVGGVLVRFDATVAFDDPGGLALEGRLVVGGELLGRPFAVPRFSPQYRPGIPDIAAVQFIMVQVAPYRRGPRVRRINPLVLHQLVADHPVRLHQLLLRVLQILYLPQDRRELTFDETGDQVPLGPVPVAHPEVVLEGLRVDVGDGDEGVLVEFGRVARGEPTLAAVRVPEDVLEVGLLLLLVFELFQDAFAAVRGGDCLAALGGGYCLAAVRGGLGGVRGGGGVGVGGGGVDLVVLFRGLLLV